jgi:hypothetical protein
MRCIRAKILDEYLRMGADSTWPAGRRRYGVRG